MVTRPRRLLVPSVILGLAMSMLTACSDSDPASDDGGMLTLYRRPLPPTLLASEADDSELASAIYGDLLRYDANEEVYGVIADDVELVDANHFTLKLREGVTFTDGTDLDAEAVKYNWEWQAREENESDAFAAARQIKSLDVVDPQTLEITLNSPNVDFPLEVTLGALNNIGSPTAMEDDIDAFARKPVAAGPFKVGEFVADDHVSLVSNPDYFESGEPSLERVEVQAVAEFDQMRNALTSSSVSMGTIANAVEMKEFEDIGLDAVQADLQGGRQYVFGIDRAPFDDKRVRQAVAMALDFQGMNEAVYNGSETVIHSLYDEDSPYYASDLEPLPFDPDAAQDLIDDYVADVGHPVEFELMTSNDGTKALEAQWIAQELNALNNVQVKVNSVDEATRTELLVDRDFQMSEVGMSFSGATIDLEPRLQSESSRNYGYYSNAKVDALLQKIRSTTDEDERTAAVHELEAIVIEDVPWVPTFGWSYGRAVTNDLDGLEIWGDNIPMLEKLNLP